VSSVNWACSAGFGSQSPYTVSAHAVLLSDLHLNAQPRSAVLRDLATVLQRHPHSHLVLNGDVFELSAFPAAEPLDSTLARILESNPEFATAIREHLSRGAKVTFVAGNHDAAVVGLGEALAARLGTATARPQVAPWFLRLGRVHVEHGHVYDPDNAPLHPLADFRSESEPLGAALMRRFITHAGALEFAHAHDTTPVQGISRAFRIYGRRAPGLIARYFGTAFALCWEAATRRPHEFALARVEGEARVSAFARNHALPFDHVESLLTTLATPTHAAFWRLFARLYFDAIFAGLAGSAALGRFLLLGSPPALGALALASGYLAAANPKRRYQGRPCRELQLAAKEVQRITDASCVVFGHTHVVEDSSSYVNLGSFTYARGARSYGVVVDGHRVEREVV
jgi:UDP-2,3-diacylglucosamine pyrophosphatase LpxH